MPAWETVELSKLEAALAAPSKVAFGEELYPSMADKTAILLYSMVKNHPWGNGNKRMGTVSAFLFAAFNDLWWDASQEEVYAHVTWIAASEARCFDATMDYLKCYFAQKLVPYDFEADPPRPK